MSKISAMPPTTVLNLTHILQVVDTAKPDLTANEHIAIGDFAFNIDRAAFMFGSALGFESLTIGILPTVVDNWDTAAVTGNSNIGFDAVAGTFTVTDAGIYELEASIVLDAITIGNDSDVILSVRKNGLPLRALATSYYVGTGGGSTQLAISFAAPTFIDLAASDAISLGFETTGAGSVTFQSRHMTMRKVV